MAVSSEYDYISWGAAEQYIISGAGAQNVIKPDSSATYHITFDPQSKTITVVKK
jgi:hypothetical protein